MNSELETVYREIAEKLEEIESIIDDYRSDFEDMGHDLEEILESETEISYDDIERVKTLLQEAYDITQSNV